MSQDHTHAIKENRFVLSLALTGLIFLAEFIGGFWTGSLALLSDSAHVFMDAFALGLSYLALRAASLPADDKHTYGWLPPDASVGRPYQRGDFVPDCL
jgi:cobalt-zinc-cadmium efflux system protein